MIADVDRAAAPLPLPLDQVRDADGDDEQHGRPGEIVAPARGGEAADGNAQERRQEHDVGEKRQEEDVGGKPANAGELEKEDEHAGDEEIDPIAHPMRGTISCGFART